MANVFWEIAGKIMYFFWQFHMLCLLLVSDLLEKLSCANKQVIGNNCREFSCNFNSCHHISPFTTSTNLTSSFTYPSTCIFHQILITLKEVGKKEDSISFLWCGLFLQGTIPAPLVQTHWISMSFPWVGGGTGEWIAVWPTRARQEFQSTTLADSFDILQSPRPPTLRPSSLHCFCCHSLFLLSQVKIPRHNLGMEGNS